MLKFFCFSLLALTVLCQKQLISYGSNAFGELAADKDVSKTLPSPIDTNSLFNISDVTAVFGAEQTTFFQVGTKLYGCGCKSALVETYFIDSPQGNSKLTSMVYVPQFSFDLKDTVITSIVSFEVSTSGAKFILGAGNKLVRIIKHANNE